jgi:hypothetical protein
MIPFSPLAEASCQIAPCCEDPSYASKCRTAASDSFCGPIWGPTASHQSYATQTRADLPTVSGAGFINSTGDCTGTGGCPKGDVCVQDYGNGYDACCARVLPLGSPSTPDGTHPDLTASPNLRTKWPQRCCALLLSSGRDRERQGVLLTAERAVVRAMLVLHVPSCIRSLASQLWSR